jgi:hypothetical protein
MEVNLVFVAPGGGETGYTIDVDLPSIPQPGDYISIFHAGHEGTADFIVRRTRWLLDQPKDSARGSLRRFFVEVEFARGFTSSQQHLRSYDTYHALTGEERRFEHSAF